jgi:hypothetical protein
MAIPSNIDNFKLKYREIPKVLDLMLVLVEVYNLLIVMTFFRFRRDFWLILFLFTLYSSH